MLDLVHVVAHHATVLFIEHVVISLVTVLFLSFHLGEWSSAGTSCIWCQSGGQSTQSSHPQVCAHDKEQDGLTLGDKATRTNIFAWLVFKIYVRGSCKVVRELVTAFALDKAEELGLWMLIELDALDWKEKRFRYCMISGTEATS